MTIATNKINVTSGQATALHDTAEQLTTQIVTVKNVGGSTVYIGGPDVTPGNGFELAANEIRDITVRGTDVLYARVAGSPVSANVLVVGD